MVILEILPVTHGFADILLLAALVSRAKQDNQRVTPEPDINSITRAKVNP